MLHNITCPDFFFKNTANQSAQYEENAWSKVMRKTIARDVIEPRYKPRRVCLYNTSQMIIWLQCRRRMAVQWYVLLIAIAYSWMATSAGTAHVQNAVTLAKRSSGDSGESHIIVLRT